MIAPFASSLPLMSVAVPTLQQTADILATLALKKGANEVVIGETDVGYRMQKRSEPTPLDPVDLFELLVGDFDTTQVFDFLGALEAGQLQAVRYSAVKGSLQQLSPHRKPIPFPMDRVIRRCDPTAETLLQTAPAQHVKTERSVPLTKETLFLATLRHIPGAAFQEALIRLLSDGPIPDGQVVWLRGDRARLMGDRIIGPLMLSLDEPQNSDAIDQTERVASIPLQYHNAAWYMIRRCSRGGNRKRVADEITRTDWGLKKTSGSFFWGHRPSQQEARNDRTGTGVTYDPTDPVAPALRDPSKAMTILPGGLPVALTRPGIMVKDLHRIAAEDFNRAVQWALGNRPPHENDRIVITAGRGFQRNGKLTESLLICPELPLPRRDMAYPKVHLRYFQGAWYIVPKIEKGVGGAKMAEVLRSIRQWGIKEWPTLIEEPPPPKAVTQRPAATTSEAIAAPKNLDAIPPQSGPELSPDQHEMLATLLFKTGAVSIEIAENTLQLKLSNQIASNRVGLRREHMRPLREERMRNLLWEDFSDASVAALLQELDRGKLRGVRLIAEQSAYFQQLVRKFDPIHPALRDDSKLEGTGTTSVPIPLTKPNIHIATMANIDRHWFEKAVCRALAGHKACHGNRLIISAERNGLHYNHVEGSIWLRRDSSPYRGEQGPWIPLLYHRNTWVLPLDQVRGSHGPALSYLFLQRDWSLARHGDKFHRPHYQFNRMDYTDTISNAIGRLSHVQVISGPL